MFVTQLEQPLDAAIRALEIAKAAGVTTILNPAPAAALPDSIYRLCDYVTPNETEAEGITGIAVASVEDARKAARRAARQGRRRGDRHARREGRAAPHREGIGAGRRPIDVGPVVETTGAGDAFNGGFAVGLSRGFDAA